MATVYPNPTPVPVGSLHMEDVFGRAEDKEARREGNLFLSKVERGKLAWTHLFILSFQKTHQARVTAECRQLSKHRRAVLTVLEPSG